MHTGFGVQRLGLRSWFPMEHEVEARSVLALKYYRDCRGILNT